VALLPPAVVIVAILGPFPEAVTALAAGWGLAAIGLWAGVLVHRRAVSSGEVSWRRVRRTIVLWGIGQIGFAATDGATGPFGPLASLLFLLTAISAAELVFRSPHVRAASAPAACLDAVAASLALAGLLWDPVLDPAVAATSVGQAVPFPLVEMAVVALGMSFLGQSGGRDRALLAIVTATAGMMVGDLLFLHAVGHGGYTAGGAGDSVWALGVAAIAGIAASPATPAPRTARRWWHQAWPAIPLVALVLEALRQELVGGLSTSIVVCGGMAVLAFVAREMVMHKEIVGLSAALEADRDRLSLAEEQARLLLEHSGDGIIGTDRQGTIVFVNRTAETLLGLARGEAQGKAGHAITHRSRPDGSPFPRAECPLGASIERGEPIAADLDWWSRTDGSFIPVEYRAVPVVRNGEQWGSVISFRDVSARIASNEALAAQERRWRSLILRSSDVVVVLDDAHRVTFTTPAVERVLGYDGSRPRGARSLSHFVHADDFAEVADMLTWLELQPVGTLQTATYRLRHAEGRWLWMEVTATNLLDDPDVAGIVCNLRDVTDRVLAQDQLRHQATHDSLTRLPNRAALRRWVDERTSVDEPYGLILLDLDGFKDVNDALGHPAGDELLCRVADRLRASVRPEDLVGRLGGDEFAALVPGVDRAGLEAVATRVLAALQVELDIAGWTLSVSASAGCTVDATRDLDMALQQADIAMYRAKRVPGGGACATYGPEDEQDRMLDLELTTALRQAIVDGDVSTWFQVKVDGATGQPAGVEALSRWTHPVHGAISPATFVALAERAGLIGNLTDLVLDRSVEQAARWYADGLDVPVAVNVSPVSLRDRGFAEAVLRRLDRLGLAPRLLEVEITEAAVADPTDAVLGNLERLRAAGVTVAIDDFGTGYSSLSYLKELPVDTLKIDRSFVDGLATDGTDREIVAAICSRGRSLGLNVIGEGVETQAIADRLLEAGCSIHQGFLYHRPAPAVDVTAVLAGRWDGACSSASFH
jgi:diguanylate cyclase (GGDEF)-like protein/PAS domain S-box-containing protein